MLVIAGQDWLARSRFLRVDHFYPFLYSSSTYFFKSSTSCPWISFFDWPHCCCCFTSLVVRSFVRLFKDKGCSIRIDQTGPYAVKRREGGTHTSHIEVIRSLCLLLYRNIHSLCLSSCRRCTYLPSRIVNEVLPQFALDNYLRVGRTIPSYLRFSPQQQLQSNWTLNPDNLSSCTWEPSSSLSPTIWSPTSRYRSFLLTIFILGEA